MEPSNNQIVIAGGGAAGIFAAITCAEATPSVRVAVLEKGPHLLSKVLISGGGRCNVTHSCFDPRRLVEFYPRGSRELIGPFHTFQPRDTVAWFESRGVKLKTEPDNRIFPVTDSSRTIADCLLEAARNAGVRLLPNCGVEDVRRTPDHFEITTTQRDLLTCNQLMLATGGCRSPQAAKLAVALGHSLVPPVPSLFAFQLSEPWLTHLAGVAVQKTEIHLPGKKEPHKGPLLITHGGISGPAVLRASAWGARDLHEFNYKFTAQINWAAEITTEKILADLQKAKTLNPAKRIANLQLFGIPSRLWEVLVTRSGLPHDHRWADLSRPQLQKLLQQITACDLQVTGKSLNKDEFVTCGGVPLREVNFKTMESRVCPGLYFGGELLDIDGITGGFNFQAAWTTGWLAGKAMSTKASTSTSTKANPNPSTHPR